MFVCLKVVFLKDVSSDVVLGSSLFEKVCSKIVCSKIAQQSNVVYNLQTNKSSMKTLFFFSTKFVIFWIYYFNFCQNESLNEGAKQKLKVSNVIFDFLEGRGSFLSFR